MSDSGWFDIFKDLLCAKHLLCFEDIKRHQRHGPFLPPNLLSGARDHILSFLLIPQGIVSSIWHIVSSFYLLVEETDIFNIIQHIRKPWKPIGEASNPTSLSPKGSVPVNWAKKTGEGFWTEGMTSNRESFKWVAVAAVENTMAISQKIKIDLPYDSVVSLPQSIHPKELKTGTQKRFGHPCSWQ